jgi:hypothetical protein
LDFEIVSDFEIRISDLSFLCVSRAEKKIFAGVAVFGRGFRFTE